MKNWLKLNKRLFLGDINATVQWKDKDGNLQRGQMLHVNFTTVNILPITFPMPKGKKYLKIRLNKCTSYNLDGQKFEFKE